MSGAAAQALDPADIETWRGHIGREEVRRQRLDIESLRRFAAATGADLDVERAMPPLGHWAWFLDAIGPSGLGPDGHPRRGGLLPAITLPRRMFAAADIAFLEPVELDAPAELSLAVVDVRHRAGRAGELMFVEVDRRLTQSGHLRLTERQTIVYRGDGPPIAPIVPVDLPDSPGAQTWTPTAVDLFRVSAATFNSHRIHYDLPYATGVEGYPGLVVHGPFTAAKLLALAQGSVAGPVRRFSFRALAPLFADQPIRLAPGSEPGEVRALRCDGVVAMTATAG